MSKLAVAVLGVMLAAVGFGLGHYTASPSDAGEAESGTARPGESGDALVDESVDALVGVLRDPDAFSRARRLATLLPTLGPEVLPEVRAALEDTSLELWATEIELLVRFWATHEPAEATHWAYTWSSPGYGTAAIAVALEMWAREDPEAALQHARTHPGSKTGNMMAQIVLVRGWYQSGRPGLEDYLSDLGEQTFEQQRALGTLARITIQRDGPEAVMRWAESLPDEPASFKLAAFRQVGTELAEADLDAARRWCDAHCDGPFGGNVRKRIATRWVVRDGPAAMEWLSTQTAGADRDFAVRIVFRGWVFLDREAAFRWMAPKGPDGLEPWLKPAVVIYTNFLAQDDAAGAAKWAPLIEDEEEREIAFIGLARRWREQDEAAAEAWLRQSPLSEEAREKAREPRPQKPARSRGQPPAFPAL
jgi:hypothetical protein